MAGHFDMIKDDPTGQRFITNYRRWLDAVKELQHKPLNIFTCLAFQPGQPELDKNSPFPKMIQGFRSFPIDSEAVQVAPQFQTTEQGVVLQKVRLYAGAGNPLETILKANAIDTVVIVCRDHYFCFNSVLTTNITVWHDDSRGRYEHPLPAARLGLQHLHYNGQLPGAPIAKHQSSVTGLAELLQTIGCRGISIEQVLEGLTKP